MRAFGAALKENIDVFAEALTKEQGKPLAAVRLLCLLLHSLRFT